MPRTHRLVVPLALALMGCPETPENQAPAFTITAPSASSLVTAGHGVELVGVVDDPDDVPQSLRVTWSADGQVVCDAIIPQPDGRSVCTWVAQLGGGSIEALVTDPEGLTGGATLEIQVQAPNHDPTCSFDAPADGSEFGASDSFELQGTAIDPDGDELSVVFSSSLDKELGQVDPDAHGAVLLEVGPLSVGEHTLTMTASDPRGARCVQEIGVEILPEDTGPIGPDTGDPAPDTGSPGPE
jgi:hypothetical protein